MNEYISLKTTLSVMDNPNFQCHVCKASYADRPELQQKRRTNKGCFRTDGPIIFRLDNFEYSTCPGNIFDYSSLFIIELYREYQKGILPFPGSYVEQPAKLIEGFQIIDGYNNKKLEDQQKKQRMLKRGNRV